MFQILKPIFMSHMDTPSKYRIKCGFLMMILLITVCEKVFALGSHKLESNICRKPFASLWRNFGRLFLAEYF